MLNLVRQIETSALQVREGELPDLALELEETSIDVALTTDRPLFTACPAAEVNIVTIYPLQHGAAEIGRDRRGRLHRVPAGPIISSPPAEATSVVETQASPGSLFNTAANAPGSSASSAIAVSSSAVRSASSALTTACWSQPRSLMRTSTLRRSVRLGVR